MAMVALFDARGMGVGFRSPSGPIMAKAGYLAALLTNREGGDGLVNDGIHRMAPAVGEILYPAMEDRALDIMIGEGPSARSVRIDLPNFTLVRPEEHTSELQSLMRSSYAVFCLKQKRTSSTPYSALNNKDTILNEK